VQCALFKATQAEYFAAVYDDRNFLTANGALTRTHGDVVVRYIPQWRISSVLRGSRALNT